MKKTVIGSLALASVVLFSSCELPGQSEKKMDAMVKEGDAMMAKDKKEMMEKDDAMMKKDDVMDKQDDSAMMKKEGNTMKKDDSAMMKKDSPKVAGYTTYSSAGVDSALASGKKVALFFHASWCISCKELHQTLSNETIPSDVVVFKVDYDSSTELKKKYGVTGQHTIVTLDANKNKVKLERGSQNIAEIAALF